MTTNNAKPESWTNYTSGVPFTIGSGLTGTYYLWIRPVLDNAGNRATPTGGQDLEVTWSEGNTGKYYRYGTYVFDNTAPTITVSPTSATACKTKSVTITVGDTGSGLSGSNSYQYCLSTSSTAVGSTWSTYTSGKSITLGSGLTGTYYLWIRQIKDNAGNTSSGNTQTVSGTVYHRYGTYVFDNTVPTITVSPTSATVCKTKSVTVTVADTGSGLSNSNSYQYYLSTSSTGFSGGTWTNYTSGKSITLGNGKTGTYYLWVKQIKDNAGNASEGYRQTVDGVIYHRYGTYVFDNTAPVVQVNTIYTNPSEILNTYMSDNYSNKIVTGANETTLKYGLFKDQTFSLAITTTDTSKISSIEWKISTNNVTANADEYSKLTNVKISGSASNKASGTQTTNFNGKKLSSAGNHYIYTKTTDEVGNVTYTKTLLYVYNDREKFVVLCYNNILGRAPEYDGFTVWMNSINDIMNGGTPKNYNYTVTIESNVPDAHIKAIVDTLYGMYFSNEYDTKWWNDSEKTKSDCIKTFYWGALSRTPTSADLQTWANSDKLTLFKGIALSTEAIEKYCNYSLNTN